MNMNLKSMMAKLGLNSAMILALGACGAVQKPAQQTTSQQEDPQTFVLTAEEAPNSDVALKDYLDPGQLEELYRSIDTRETHLQKTPGVTVTQKQLGRLTCKQQIIESPYSLKVLCRMNPSQDATLAQTDEALYYRLKFDEREVTPPGMMDASITRKGVGSFYCEKISSQNLESPASFRCDIEAKQQTLRKRSELIHVRQNGSFGTNLNFDFEQSELEQLYNALTVESDENGKKQSGRLSCFKEILPVELQKSSRKFNYSCYFDQSKETLKDPPTEAIAEYAQKDQALYESLNISEKDETNGDLEKSTWVKRVGKFHCTRTENRKTQKTEYSCSAENR